MSSDIRLKENIRLVGKSSDGHNLYRWDWNNKARKLGIKNELGFGVIAQELIKTDPMAVTQNEEGYYQVNYKGFNYHG